MTHVAATVETCAWGYFDAARAPAATIESGETVTIDSVSGGPEALPGPGYIVPLGLLDIHERSERPIPGHILTGPVAVEGARAGTTLQIDILDVRLSTDWGYNAMRPLAGILPDEVPEKRIITIPLDRDAMTGRLPWGLDLPLAPFFGVMGVAPPPEWGRISSIEPRKHGGNLDLKELVAGTTLYLPVWNDGALFSVGDGHGVQGDGEVCITAIETALTGTFRLTARPDMPADTPRAETPTHWITMGISPDLDTCAADATRRMVDLIRSRAGLSWADAFTLLSLAGDLRITQAVNGNKGVHMMLAKTLLT